jgi:hypothetical protein
VVEKLLADKPEDRYTSARDLIRALKAVMSRPWWQRPPFLAAALIGVLAVALAWALTRHNGPQRDTAGATPDSPSGSQVSAPGPTVPALYTGRVDVLIERTTAGVTRLLRLNQPGVLPLRQDDKLRIEAEVDPPAYVYILWLDPSHDITPVYPWSAEVGWGSRPAKEQPVRKISLPANAGMRYTAPLVKPGVATMLLLARAARWNIADSELKTRLESLPDLPLPPGGDQAAVWFDNFVEVRELPRARTFGVAGSDDSFARWQGELQKLIGGQVTFQTAVSFARTGEK